MPPRLFQIFIAYSRKDAALLEELRTHLKSLERSGRAKVWSDGDIEAGAEWEAAIRHNLHHADIILLLVSADAIASDYFYEKELPDALARHERGEARVVPLVVRHCAWKATSFAKLQVLPRDGKAVASWSDRDEAWSDAVERLLALMDGIEEEERRLLEAEQRRRLEEARRKKEAEDRRKKEQEAARRRALDPFHDLMVRIEGGSFQMGSNEYGDEKPIRQVTLKGFLLGKFPVTQAQWQKIMGENPSHFKGCGDCPVESVSWDDVQLFLKKLNETTGAVPSGNDKYRLPFEAEWEYAARGGSKSKGFKFSGSNDLDEVGRFRKNSGSKTHPVGQKKANELGLHDMSGNVWEWCGDVWHGSYEGAPTDGSPWTTGDEESRRVRVLRGGSWVSVARFSRSSYRVRVDAGLRYYDVGFRVAQDF